MTMCVLLLPFYLGNWEHLGIRLPGTISRRPVFLSPCRSVDPLHIDERFRICAIVVRKRRSGKRGPIGNDESASRTINSRHGTVCVFPPRSTTRRRDFVEPTLPPIGGHT